VADDYLVVARGRQIYETRPGCTLEIATAYDRSDADRIAIALNGAHAVREDERERCSQRIADLQEEMGKQLAARDKEIARLREDIAARFIEEARRG
jgi:hypothetical protein